MIENPEGFTQAVDQLVEKVREFGPVDKIVSPEARGFIFGAPVARQLNCGLVLVRKPGKLPADLAPYIDPETGLLPLGDMAISYEKAEAQAKEFGHSVKRELGYLTIHSILHLLGYDHMDEGPMKKQMRAREEAICSMIDLKRENS